jgi:hypothetical protein
MSPPKNNNNSNNEKHDASHEADFFLHSLFFFSLFEFLALLLCARVSCFISFLFDLRGRHTIHTCQQEADAQAVSTLSEVAVLNPPFLPLLRRHVHRPSSYRASLSEFRQKTLTFVWR